MASRALTPGALSAYPDRSGLQSSIPHGARRKLIERNSLSALSDDRLESRTYTATDALLMIDVGQS